jgi:hypothetical protein
VTKSEVPAKCHPNKSISICSARILCPNSIYIAYIVPNSSPIRLEAKFTVQVNICIVTIIFVQKQIKRIRRPYVCLASLMVSTPARLCAFQLRTRSWSQSISTVCKARASLTLSTHNGAMCGGNIFVGIEEHNGVTFTSQQCRSRFGTASIFPE